MKILITGASGMLGTDLVSVLEQNHKIIPLTHKDLDISNPQAIRKKLSDLKLDRISSEVEIE
jgi:dTDP-4-dehydrorhamnose reductase